MDNAGQAWHWDKLEEMYPLNPKWDEEGWSCPRWPGTGREPTRGECISDRPEWNKYKGDPILPERINLHDREVSVIFDGHYVYTCSLDDPQNNSFWFPHARAPQDYGIGWQNPKWWDASENGRMCLLPVKEARLWIADTEGYEADHQLVDLIMSGNAFCGVKLNGVFLQGALLKQANLEGANLSRARLDNAELSWANLAGAQLSGASLTKAGLMEVNLAGSNLRDAHLEGADLRWARLEESDLGMANLEGADLSWAHLERADLSWVKIGVYELIRSSLTGREQIERCETNLTEANISYARLHGLDFRRVDLRYLNGLENAALIDCRFEGAILHPDQLKTMPFTARIALAVTNYRLNWLGRFSEHEISPWLRFEAELDAIGAGPVARTKLPREWLGYAHETYLRIKKCYLDQGAYDDASEMAYREKEMERELCMLNCHAAVAQILHSIDSCFAVLGAWVLAMLLWPTALLWAGGDTHHAGNSESFGVALHRYRQGDWEPWRKLHGSKSLSWASVGKWFYHGWKLNGYLVYRWIVGYGERPHYVIYRLIESILIFACVFFIIGTPVMHEGGAFGVINLEQAGEYKDQVVMRTASPERVYGLIPNIDDPDLPWNHELARAAGQSLILSLESISSLGFFWLSEYEYRWQDFWAALECLWGVFLAAMFVWCVGRKLSAR